MRAIEINRLGYERKKKNKKTQKIQYDDDDNHHVQRRIFGYCGIILYSQDGSVLIL